MSFATSLARRILGISIILYGMLQLAPGGPVDVHADNPLEDEGGLNSGQADDSNEGGVAPPVADRGCLGPLDLLGARDGLAHGWGADGD